LRKKAKGKIDNAKKIKTPFRIIDAQTEHLYGTPTVRYVCLHKEFIEVEEGFLIPEYNISKVDYR
jgi:hypothetical protein